MTPLRLLFAVAFLLLLLSGAGVWWYYQPERSVQREWQRVLRAIEKRQWSAVATRLAEDYHDVWGQDRASALARAEDVLRVFFVVQVTSSPVADDASPAVEILSPDTARLRAKLQLSGTGGPLAAEWMRRFNQLPGAFTISWHRLPGWPPRWQITSVHHDRAARLAP